MFVRKAPKKLMKINEVSYENQYRCRIRMFKCRFQFTLLQIFLIQRCPTVRTAPALSADRHNSARWYRHCGHCYRYRQQCTLYKDTLSIIGTVVVGNEPMECTRQKGWRIGRITHVYPFYVNGRMFDDSLRMMYSIDAVLSWMVSMWISDRVVFVCEFAEDE